MLTREVCGMHICEEKRQNNYKFLSCAQPSLYLLVMCPPVRRGSGDIRLIPWVSLKIHSLRLGTDN